MNLCHKCRSEIPENKNFCNKVCYFSRKNYRNHSEETKRKIAKGNSKPLTEQRKKNISLSKQKPIDEELLKTLNHLWSLTYLSPKVIKEISGLSKGSRIYKNLFKQFCKHEQKKFMPSDWYPEHYQKLFELADQRVWFKQIAKILGFGQKQVYSVMNKLGLQINTRDPNAWSCVTSKLEFEVISWIKEQNYKVETQFHIGNFFYDGHIKNSNILIEVNGDYWHCNPQVYKNGPINQMQKSHIRRDFAKKGYAAKQGYYLVTIWEKSVKDSPAKTKEWLLDKIKSNIVETKND